MFRKTLLLVVALMLLFSALNVYGAESNVVKYDKEIGKIDIDIEPDVYLLISKDVTKPAYAGIYTSGGGSAVNFEKREKLLYGTEADYVYPHYFENNGYYNYTDSNVASNVGECKLSRYFEYSYCIDLNSYKYNDNLKNSFLYLQNCYAIPVKDIQKEDVDFCRDGFMPIEGNMEVEKDYIVKIADEERTGFFACYKYDKFSKELKALTTDVIYNSKYIAETKGLNLDSRTFTIPEDTDIILKVGVDICDKGGDIIYKHKGIAYPDTFVEKYDFNDVSPFLKNLVKQEFKAQQIEEKALRNKPSYFTKTTTEMGLDRKKVFKTFNEFAKTDADKEYVKYVREIYAMYNQTPYIDLMIGKYLFSATKFADLDYLLRRVAYNDYRIYYYLFLSGYY